MATEVKKTSGQLELERRAEKKRLLAEKNRIVITDFSVCYFCKTKGLTGADAFCPNCAFPQRGTEGEQKTYIGEHMIQKIRLEEMADAVIKARNMLFAISGLTLVPYLLGSITSGDWSIFGIGIFVACLYGGLALWSKKQPFPAILTGLILYVSLWVLYIVINPVNIFSGILYKIAGLSALYYGFKAARNYENLKKQVDLKSTSMDLATPISDETGTESGNSL